MNPARCSSNQCDYTIKIISLRQLRENDGYQQGTYYGITSGGQPNSFRPNGYKVTVKEDFCSSDSPECRPRHRLRPSAGRADGDDRIDNACLVATGCYATFSLGSAGCLKKIMKEIPTTRAYPAKIYHGVLQSGVAAL